MYINFSRLWKTLAEKELTKSDLMELTGLSSRVIAKLAKNETVTTDTVAKLCAALHCRVEEVMECAEESELSLCHYSRAFGKILEETESVRKIGFFRGEKKYVIYQTKHRASRTTRIDCGEDGTVYETCFYIGGGHGTPSVVKKVLVRPVRNGDETVLVVVKGKPGTIAGLDEGMWVSAKNGRLQGKNDIFVMSEAAFKVFEPSF